MKPLGNSMNYPLNNLWLLYDFFIGNILSTDDVSTPGGHRLLFVSLAFIGSQVLKGCIKINGRFGGISIYVKKSLQAS